eukprot:TRINITY_DN4124_c0_g1_i4.p1 TRINITY_DN4124_c0_g1~~TRINITY_DN4124_c0_g1_i4.p1  ORF type:complete len:2972 (-),score=556.03 TRINITY_DN4124_c0_g1_i4:44-8959(-)
MWRHRRRRNSCRGGRYSNLNHLSSTRTSQNRKPSRCSTLISRSQQFTQVGELHASVCVHGRARGGVGTVVDDQQAQPLVDIFCCGVQARIGVASQRRDVSFSMQSLRVVDNWVVLAGEKGGGSSGRCDETAKEFAVSPVEETLFSVLVVDKTACPPEVAVSAGTLAVQVNLATIAEVMRVLDIGVKPDRGPPVKREERPIVNVTVQFRCLNVTINSEAAHLARFEVAKLYTKATVRKRTLEVAGSLGSLHVIDLTAEGVVHREAFRSLGDEMINFSVNVYNSRETQTYPGYDVLVSIRMSTVRVVLLKRFVSLLLDYIAVFQDARTALVQQLYSVLPSGDSKLVFSVQAEHPLLIIPRHSLSGTCIVADLNDVAIRNTFHDQKDDMAIKVSKLRLFTCELNPSPSPPPALPRPPPTYAEWHFPRIVVDKVDLAVHYIRPLCPNGTIPDSDVSVTCDNAVVNLDVLRYNMFMAIVFENFDENPLPLPRTTILSRKPDETPPEGQPLVENSPWRAYSAFVPRCCFRFFQEGAAASFVELSVCDFSAKYEQHDFERIATVGVGAVTVHDGMQQYGAGLETLLSDDQSLIPARRRPLRQPVKTASGEYEPPAFAHRADGTRGEDIVAFKMVRVFHPGGTMSQRIALAFNRLCVNLNSETFVAWYKFVCPLPSEHNLPAAQEQSQQQETMNSTTFEVSLHRLVIVLNSHGNRFATVEFKHMRTKMEHDAKAQLTHTKGHLTNCTVVEFDTGRRMLSFDVASAAPSSPTPPPQSDTSTSLFAETENNRGSLLPDRPAGWSSYRSLIRFDTWVDPHESRVWARIRDPTCVVVPAFISQMGAYTTELSLMISYLRSSAEKAIETVATPPTLWVDVELQGPHIFIPACSTTDDQATVTDIKRGLEMNLGKLTVCSATSELDDPRALTASLRDVSLVPHYSDRDLRYPRAIVEKIDMDFLLKRVPCLTTRLNIQSVGISVTEDDVDLLITILCGLSATRENIAEPSLDFSSIQNASKPTTSSAALATVVGTTVPPLDGATTPAAIESASSPRYSGTLSLEQLSLRVVDIASFTIYDLVVTGDYDSSELDLQLHLTSITLMDIQPGSDNVFTSVITSDTSPEVPLEPQAAVSSATTTFLTLQPPQQRVSQRRSSVAPTSAISRTLPHPLKNTSLGVVRRRARSRSPTRTSVQRARSPSPTPTSYALAPEPHLAPVPQRQQRQLQVHFHRRGGVRGALPAYNSSIVIGRLRVFVLPAVLGALLRFAQRVRRRAAISGKQAAQTINATAAATNLPQLRGNKEQISLEISVTVSEPECIAVEDHTSSNSHAAVLRFGKFAATATVAEGTPAMSVTLERLELFSCMLDQRATTQVAILEPCNLSFYVRQRNANELKIKLVATDVISTVSYNDLKLSLMMVLQFVNISKADVEQREEAPQLATAITSARLTPESSFITLRTPHRASPASTDSAYEVISNYGIRELAGSPPPLPPRKLSRSVAELVAGKSSTSVAPIAELEAATATVQETSHSLASEQEAAAAVDQNGAFPYALLGSYQFRATVLVPSVRLTIVNDRNGGSVPVADANLMLLKAKSYDSFTLSTLFLQKAEARCFNENLSLWEPLLEPWSLHAEVIRGSGSCTVSLTAEQPLDLTLTPSFVSSFMAVYSTWLSDYKSYRTSAQGVSVRKIFKPYRLINGTGHPVTCIMVAGDPVNLAPYDSVEIDMQSAEPRGEMLMQFLVDGCTPSPWLKVNRVQICAVSLGSIGVGAGPLASLSSAMPSAVRKRKKDQLHQPVLVLRVRRENGTKVVSVESVVRVKAMCGHNIDMKLALGDVETTMHVAAGASSCIPLHFTSRDCLCYVRPSACTDSVASWSEPFRWADCLEATSAAPLRCLDGDDCYNYCVHSREKENVPRSATSIVNSAEVKPDGTGSQPDTGKAEDAVEAALFVCVVSAPVQVSNLLPYAFNYELMDRTASTSLTGCIRPAEVLSVHELSVSHELSLRIQLVEHHGFRGWSDVVPVRSNVVDAARNVTLRACADCGRIITLNSERLGTLPLSLHYTTVGKVAWRITVHCPYWVHNHAALPLQFFNYCVDPTEGMPVLFAEKSSGGCVATSTHVKVGTSDWSKSVSLSTPGDGALTLSGATQYDCYDLSLKIDPAPAPFAAPPRCTTRVLTFGPRYVLCNACPDFNVTYRIPKVVSSTLSPQQSCPLYFGNVKLLQIKIPGFSFSGFFAVEQVDEFPLRLHCASSAGSMYIANVDVSLVGAEVRVSILPETRDPPFLIENWSSYPITCYQKDARMHAVQVPPLHSYPFAWDEPLQQRVLCVSHVEVDVSKLNRVTEFDIAETNTAPAHRLRVQIVPRNLCRVIKVANVNEASLRDADSGDVERPPLTVKLALRGIGFSIVDAKEELIYAYLGDIEVATVLTNLKFELICLIAELQIDCQARKALYPVLLYPTPPELPQVRKEQDQQAQEEQVPVVQFSMKQLTKSSNTNIRYFAHITAAVLPLELNVEELLIDRVVQMLKIFNDEWEKRDSASASAASPISVASQAMQTRNQLQRVYVETLMLHPLIVNLSFAPSVAHAEDEGERLRVMSIVHHLGAVNHAPLVFPALYIKHYYAPAQKAQTRVLKHYSDTATRQVLRFAGSADILGNPVSFYHNVKKGISDLVVQPYRGMVVLSPKQIGCGIGRGTKSLAKHSLYAVFNSASSFSSYVGSTISNISGDESYLVNRQRRMLAQSSSLSQGLVKGGRVLASGVASGFTGVFMTPVRAVQQREGTRGVVGGAVSGVIGLVTKPTAGLFDMLSSTAEGIKSEAGFVGRLNKRIRPPRIVTSDGVVTAYSRHTAQAHLMLMKAQGSVSHPESYEGHISCVLLIDTAGNECVAALVVSTGHLWCISQYGDEDVPKVIWKLPRDDKLEVHPSTNSAHIIAVYDGRQYPCEWDLLSLHTAVVQLAQLLRHSNRSNDGAMPPRDNHSAAIREEASSEQPHQL